MFAKMQEAVREVKKKVVEQFFPTKEAIRQNVLRTALQEIAKTGICWSYSWVFGKNTIDYEDLLAILKKITLHPLVRGGDSGFTITLYSIHGIKEEVFEDVRWDTIHYMLKEPHDGLHNPIRYRCFMYSRLAMNPSVAQNILDTIE